MTNAVEQIMTDAAKKNENIVNSWVEQCDTLGNILLEHPAAKARHTEVSRSENLIFVRLDALDKKDYPNGISMNSVYLTFTANLFTKKVELHSQGHVYLSPKDKESEKYKYLAMKSMVDVYVDKGGKKFRKQKFADMVDLYNKVATYYKNVMQAVDEYTGGYPYKEGV